MIQGLVIDHTNAVSAELAACYAGMPGDELATWIAMAQQREAMVVSLYKAGAARPRIPPARFEPVRDVVAKAIGSIWAQEATHTAQLAGLQTVADKNGWQVRLEATQGSLEGGMTHRATQAGAVGVVARWLVGLARSAGVAPEFTAHLSALSFPDFCRFSNELERTAIHGYERMVELIDQIERGQPDLRFGLWTRYEIGKTLAEERLHAAVFVCLLGWAAGEGAELVAPDAARCVSQLRALASRYLPLQGIAEIPAQIRRDPRSGGEGDGSRSLGDETWVSDGGFGSLFREFELEVPLVDESLLKAAYGG